MHAAHMNAFAQWAFLAIGAFLALMGLLYLYFKHSIAYSHCEGGAPLLDYVFAIPMIFGMAAKFIAIGIGRDISGSLVALVALAVTTITIQIAWRAGARAEKKRKAAAQLKSIS